MKRIGEINNVINWISGYAKSLLNAYPELIAYIVVCAIVLWLNLHKGIYVFYYDAEIYWNLRSKFDQQFTVPFSLLNFNIYLRSYLLPLIYYSISRIALFIGMRDVIFLEIIHALIFSGFISVIIPRIVKIFFYRRVDFLQITLFSSFILFFWQGYFYYPLSDFWAVFLLIAGVYAFLLKSLKWWGLIIVGMTWGGASLVRPSYVSTLIFLFPWTIYYLYRYHNLTIKRIALAEFVITLGLVVILLPQSIINFVHFDTLSPLPQTQLKYGGNLYTKQLSWGIEVQRYETFVGSKLVYSPRGVLFIDNHGKSILFRSGMGPFPIGLSDSFLTLQEYISLVTKHPLDFFVLYLRHLFNGLDIVYSTPYILDLYENTIYIRLINYSLWFLFMLFVGKCCIKSSVVLTQQFFLLMIFALPSLLSIPIVVEVRFMLPLHIIAYSAVAFYIFPLFRTFPRREKISLIFKYVPWYVAFVSMCLILSSNTFSNLKHGAYMFW